MRVISGTARGLKLVSPAGLDTRPTLDRVKEALFSILAPELRGAAVLDLFAGSGALSFEAISRGAARAVLLDKDKRSVEIIRKNAESLGFEAQCEIRNEDCFIYAERTGEKFDIIFLDPPYNKGIIEPVLDKIAKKELLADGGIIVLESDGTDFSGERDGLAILKQRRYGRTYITVYEKQVTKE